MILNHIELIYQEHHYYSKGPLCWWLPVGPTSPAEQHGGVGDTQQAVVTETLQHGSVHMEAAGQVLRGEGCPTDEPSQALTHGQRLSQLP